MPDQLDATNASAPQPDCSLTPDCERCCGLCCVAPAFSVSTDFAIEKGPGVPCPNLTNGFRCAIHDSLEAEGFSGCVAYDCYGAGQRVTQLTFKGQDWRRTPAIAASMFATFMVMRQLHELLMYLTEALKLGPAEAVCAELQLELDQIDRLTQGNADALMELDVAARKRTVEALLLRVGQAVRDEASRPPP